MGLNPEVWGPHYWFFIHTVAMSYPLSPNEITKKKYYSLINDMPLFIPDQKCAKNFSDLLDKYPVTPYLDSRASFTKWAHFIHNKINFTIGKPQVSSVEAMNRYNLAYKPPELTDADAEANREKLIYLGVICAMLGLSLLAWRNSRVV